MLQSMVLQNVVPKWDKRGRAGIYDERAALREETLHEGVKLALIHASAF